MRVYGTCRCYPLCFFFFRMKERLGHFKINYANSLLIFLRCQDTYLYYGLPATGIFPTLTFVIKCGSWCHGATVDSVAASQLQASQLDPELGLLFLRSYAYVCVTLPGVLQFPLSPQNMPACELAGLNCE